MSTNKISIGNGRFCYSGPSCRLHGEKQVEAARTNLLSALNKVNTAKTLDEMMVSRQELESAKIAYDSTPEGLGLLKEHLSDTDDANLKLELQVRLNNAEKFAAAFEKQEEKDEGKVQGKTKPELGKGSGLVTVGQLNEDYTYDAPTSTVVSNDNGISFEVGNKYEGWKPVKDIAAKVRKDFKEATEQGYLPAGLRYSVTIDKFSGGQAIRVEVLNTKDEEMWVDDPQARNDWGDREPYARKDYSPLHKDLSKRVQLIANAYNSQEIPNPLSEYLSVAYYSSVKIETERTRGQRLQDAEVAAVKRSEKPVRDRLLKSFREAPSQIDTHLNYTKTASTSYQDVKIGKVPDTHIWVAKLTNTRNGVNSYEAYDFSDKTLPEDPEFLSEKIKEAFDSGKTYSLMKRNFLKRPRRTHR